ncbi:transporter substrate-binding domain-containing protein [Gilvimarinus agarilyticus]|uniref:substrate-binding periplasmic protein n=1 Tax=unclassified Gilvimarinus TaxID=2642066 RepID=UPI001C0A537B|nr:MULTISPECIES: transporter substrate-binding domain-containing protein [unclassified Gilvimarinus]MBU2885296.1 transporter substrate-binding domain-containing protein [Gilvimarinus agarilyticus]MDO6570195.1 transporter substrate-binding domain-containing protein [Gilvimarinus sp. 2_MG-2023]MDO6748190.1 transporter substrate-binding domain-containing protein [Gilvimarinus sp. 1_MG-2023]
MSRLIRLLLTIVSLSAPLCLGQDDPVQVGTFPIPLMVESPEKGRFIELMQRIAQDADLKLNIIVTPAKRATRFFIQGEIDIFLPALEGMISPEHRVIKSQETIYTKEDFVFTRRGTPLLSSMSDLAGKRIGITRGYPYTPALLNNKSLKLELSSSDEQSVKMLVRGRVDAIVVEEHSGRQAFKNTGQLDQMQYNPEQQLSQMPVYIAYQDTDRGHQLAKLIDKTLRELKSDGSFAKTFHDKSQ